MTSYLRKYVTALASAKDYIAQWSSDHVYADEELIVPFPTLAIFNPDRHLWEIDIKAWVYLPFQPKPLTSYLPSLPSFLKKKTSDDDDDDESEKDKKADENEKKEKKTVFNEEDQSKIKAQVLSTSDITIDGDKKEIAAAVDKENHEAKKQNGSSDDEATDSDDDIYEEALQDEFGEPEDNPGRLGLFFVGNSVKIATKSIINGVEHLLNPSDESGFIEQHLEFSNHEMKKVCTNTHEDCEDRKFEYKIQLHNEKKEKKEEDEEKKEKEPEQETDTNQENTNDYKIFKCTVFVLARHGTSIISDIDDTVKISNVLSKRLLLKHTFYSYFKPVEHMSEVYQKWHEQNCQFHYVSASPWQLYPALRCFLEKYKFPHGTINLRKFNWKLEFFKPADTYKMEAISEIIDSYPLRKYICVGDSGELDPEVYSKIYEKYPQAISHIFIRDVCSTPECTPTCAERYKKAFENVPKERWTVFKNANEIETDLQKILSV